MVMEGIIPLEQQVMSKLTKALNYRRMMDRIRAAKVVVPPPPVPNTPVPTEEAVKFLQGLKNANLSGFQPTDTTHSHMNPQFPTVEEMLKGISTVPTAVKGEPDSLTSKEATMEKEAAHRRSEAEVRPGVAGSLRSFFRHWVWAPMGR